MKQCPLIEEITTLKDERDILRNTNIAYAQEIVRLEVKLKKLQYQLAEVVKC